MISCLKQEELGMGVCRAGVEGGGGGEPWESFGLGGVERKHVTSICRPGDTERDGLTDEEGWGRGRAGEGEGGILRRRLSVRKASIPAVRQFMFLCFCGQSLHLMFL